VALTPVEIDVEGERHQATPPVVLGRTRGPGSQDALAVKTPNGEVLHVFKGVYARWGCAGSDTDCTSSTQLEIAVEGGALVVRNVGKFPTYSQGRPIDRIVLGPGQWAELTLPGVYTHDGKKARIVIKTPGVAPVRSATESATPADCKTCCEVFCEAWRIINQIYHFVREGRAMTAKELEELEKLFYIFKGHLDGLATTVVQAAPDAVKELVNFRIFIELILPQLKQGNPPPETISTIITMYHRINNLKQQLEQQLACRC
jgi:hypothetical protein